MRIRVILSLLMVSFMLAGSVSAEERVIRSRDRAMRHAIREKFKNQERLLGLSDDIDIQTDIPYVNNAHRLQKLDVYKPVQSEEKYTARQEVQGPYPVLFHVHGGGWKIGDKKRMRETGVFYAAHDVLFITPNYRLAPQVKHPVLVQDCAAALAWTFDHVKELGGDKSRIYISGHSAGAQLVSLLATNPKYLRKYGIDPARLAGVISNDTASFDLTSDANEKMVKGFIRQAFGTDPQILKEASPFYNLSGHELYPKFLVLNTTERKNAVTAAQNFVNKLRSMGGDVEFVPIDNHSHREMAEGMYAPLDPVSSTILRFVK